MKKLDIEIFKELPKGLMEEFARIGKSKDEKEYLRNSRDILEKLVLNLCIANNIEFNQNFTKAFNRLQELKVIEDDVAIYVKIWWDISSLASHSIKVSNLIFDYKTHLNTCFLAIENVIKWYLNTFKPYTFSQKESFLEWMNAYFISNQKVTLPNKIISDFDNIINQNVIFLKGEPWVGKTSIASYISNYLVKEHGYIPIIFHESNILNYSHIFNDDSYQNLDGEINRVDIFRLYNKIYSFVSTQHFYGNKFLFFLDDPFGHRKFKIYYSIFSNILLGNLLKLNNKSGHMGDVKFIITSPDTFILELIDYSKKINNITIDSNIKELLNPQNILNLSMKDYDKTQISQIVQSVALKNKCEWSMRDEVTDLIADEIITNQISFDSLFSFCVNKRRANDDEIINTIEIYFKKLTNIKDAIIALENIDKKYLSSFLITSIIITIYNNYHFQSNIDTRKIIEIFDITATEDYALKFADWITINNNNENKFSFAEFKHPEIRSAVEDYFLNTERNIFLEVFSELCDLSKDYLAKWETLHLYCKFSRYLTKDQCLNVDNSIFKISKHRGFYPTNTFYALIENWDNIKHSNLHHYALNCLNRLIKEFKDLNRQFVYEFCNAWMDLDEEVRMYLFRIITNDEETFQKKIINEELFIVFIYSYLLNYHKFESAAKINCKVTIQCREIFNQQLIILVEKRKSSFFKSKQNDYLFNNPGALYTGKDVFLFSVENAIKSGGIDENNQMIENIKNEIMKM